MEESAGLLPIGSVVSLRGGEKKLMIFGLKQTDDSLDKTFDYVGVLYPEGNLGPGSQFFFEHKDVETVHFTGYETAQWTALRDALAEYYAAKDRQPPPETDAGELEPVLE